MKPNSPLLIFNHIMVASALVFGQLINNEIVWWVVAIGVSFFCLCIVISSLLRKEKRQDKNG